MNFGLVFFQFLPLLLYIGIDYWKGFKPGIIAAIAAAVFMCSFEYLTSGTVDQFSLGESFLIVLLGIISLKMNNDRFFKYQPTVLAFIFAGIFTYFELKHEPLVVRYVPHMEKMFLGADQGKSLSAHANPQKANPSEQSAEVKEFLANIHSEKTQRSFAILSRLLIGVFIAHGLIMAYAARHWSTPKWFAWRLAIYPGVAVAAMASMMMA